MRPSDVTTFATYRNLPEVARYQDWELPYTRDLAHQLIDEMDGINGPVAGEWVQLAIADIDGTLVGDLAVYLDADTRTAMIGYRVDPAHQGRGYATEAVPARSSTGSSTGCTCTASRRRSIRQTCRPRGARAARFQVRGAGCEGGVRPRRVGRRRPLRDPRRRACRWAGRVRTPPVDVHLIEVAPDNRVEVGRITTHRSRSTSSRPCSARSATR